MSLLRRHWGFVTLAGLGLLLRVLTMIAYPPAFWFYGDSGSFIERSLRPLDPYNTGGLGYIMALKVFRVFGGTAVVAGLQHLAGVLVAVAIYALLARRGLPRWLACLAALPMLLDPLQITLEHYLLNETLFTSLAMIGILLLLWPRVPNIWACGAAGLAIAMSWFTRPSTLAVTVVLVVYLLVRRVGWKRVVAFAAAFIIPYVAVLAWIGDRPTAYGGSLANRALYSRVAGWVDCERLTLTAQEARLCPKEPLGQRHDRADWYGWNGPALDVPIDDNAVLGDFAMKAIKEQPADYAKAVWRELVPHFVPGMVSSIGPEHVCLRGRYDLPTTMRDLDVPTSCAPALAQSRWAPEFADPSTAPPATGLTHVLHAYSGTLSLPPIVTSLAFLLVLIGVVRRRSSRDAVMLAFVAGALLVPPVLVGMYEARYGLPVLPIVSLMAALALHRLLESRPSQSLAREENIEQHTAIAARP